MSIFIHLPAQSPPRRRFTLQAVAIVARSIDDYTDFEARDEIALIAEANLPEKVPA